MHSQTIEYQYYDENVQQDVIVVGGGIVGTTAAWRLAQRGMAVTVVDSGRIGGESSHAGAGMLAPGGEAGAESVWARRMVESLALYPAFVEELKSATGLPILSTRSEKSMPPIA